MSPQLKLIALDADDLAVISTHVQDARVQPADIVWRQSEKRLVVGMSRLDWEQTLDGDAEPRRLVAALRFDLAASDEILDLIGIEFHSQDGREEEPGGSALLLFAQGGAIRLDVECLECELTDLGADELGTGLGIEEEG
jgi:hypothetical protein